MKPCPAECGRQIRGADVLCPHCLGKVSHDTRAELSIAWRTFNRTFSTPSMAAYERVIRQATREARLSNMAARGDISSN